MALTRLQNIISSVEGRILYVNPDDFDATDAIDNKGNSPIRPFKTIARAVLEVAGILMSVQVTLMISSINLLYFYIQAIIL